MHHHVRPDHSPAKFQLQSRGRPAMMGLSTETSFHVFMTRVVLVQGTPSLDTHTTIGLPLRQERSGSSLHLPPPRATTPTPGCIGRAPAPVTHNPAIRRHGPVPNKCLEGPRYVSTTAPVSWPARCRVRPGRSRNAVAHLTVMSTCSPWLRDAPSLRLCTLDRLFPLPFYPALPPFMRAAARYSDAASTGLVHTPDRVSQ